MDLFDVRDQARPIKTPVGNWREISTQITDEEAEEIERELIENAKTGH